MCFYVDFLVLPKPVLGYYLNFYQDLSYGFNTVRKACSLDILKVLSPVNGSVKKSGLKFDPFQFSAKM